MTYRRCAPLGDYPQAFCHLNWLEMTLHSNIKLSHEKEMSMWSSKIEDGNTDGNKFQKPARNNSLNTCTCWTWSISSVFTTSYYGISVSPTESAAIASASVTSSPAGNSAVMRLCNWQHGLLNYLFKLHQTKDRCDYYHRFIGQIPLDVNLYLIP